MRLLVAPGYYFLSFKYRLLGVIELSNPQEAVGKVTQKGWQMETAGITPQLNSAADL